LVAYGFRALRRVGGYDYAQSAWDEMEDRDDVY
jgi:hypothetical protein